MCVDMYLELQDSEAGRVTWRYLKPLIVGYVYYTPRNALTQAIMKEVMLKPTLKNIQYPLTNQIDFAGLASV